MGQRIKGLRLRRDLKGLAAGREGESILLVFALFPILLGTEPGNVICSLLFFGLLLFAYVPCQVVLGETLLDAGHGFSRSAFGRLLVDRSEIVRARDGMISHLRGTKVPGVRLELVDGTSVAVPLSGLLGEDRRQAWISQINTWAHSTGPGREQR